MKLSFSTVKTLMRTEHYTDIVSTIIISRSYVDKNRVYSL